MKKALDSYLSGGKPEIPAAAGPGPSDFEKMFGGQMDEDEQDPLASALAAAGYEVDEAKLTQIKSILDADPSKPSPLAGTESPEEEDMEAGKSGGVVPAAMSPKAGKKF